MNTIPFVISTCACVLIACSSDRNVSSPNAPGERSLFGLSVNGTTSTMQLYKKVYRDVRYTSGESVADIHLWHPDSSNSVSGNTVSINGIPIGPHMMNGSTVYKNSSVRDTVPLRFDGSWHVFKVAGAEGFPALIDSVRAPVGETVITYPLPGTTISRAAGFTLTWTPAADANGVLIWISDTATTVGSKSISRTFTGNPGSYTVTADELASLKPGLLTVSVVRGNYRSGVVEDRPYLLLLGSGQDVYCKLVP